MDDRVDDATIDAVAARHGFNRAAVAALWDALRRGGGRMAQFSHPELGGMGQWSSGGMLQIGAMFDHALKARVAAACADLVAAAGSRLSMEPDEAAAVREGAFGGENWWPGSFGSPSAAGSQNGIRYAYFADACRLAVDRDGMITLYDTGRHRIFGVSQSQSRGSHLAFTADDETVDLGTLAVVERSRVNQG